MTHGPKPVMVLPGLMLTSALMTPRLTHVTAVPAMIPFAAAVPRLMSDETGGEVRITVAVPEMAPLVAFTVFVYVAAIAPPVKAPEPALIVPPPLTTDQTATMGNELPLASRP